MGSRSNKRLKVMTAEPILWSSDAWTDADDAQLLAECRRGREEAYGELWRRHLSLAYAAANRWRGRSAPEDIVAEASARVFAQIRDGHTPAGNFRAHFLSVVRSVAVDRARRELRADPSLSSGGETGRDPIAGDSGAQVYTDLIRVAFGGLSEADQRVLWHTTVEGSAPRAAAPLLGMTPTGVGIRAKHARDALQARYLEAYATQTGYAGADTPECRWVIGQLGALARDKVPKRHRPRLEAHLASCPHAAAVAADVRAVHDRMPALIVPFLLAAGLSTKGFLSAASAASLTGVLETSPTTSPWPATTSAVQQIGRLLAPVATVLIAAASTMGHPTATTGMPGVPAPTIAAASGSSASTAGSSSAAQSAFPAASQAPPMTTSQAQTAPATAPGARADTSRKVRPAAGPTPSPPGDRSIGPAQRKNTPCLPIPATPPRPNPTHSNHLPCLPPQAQTPSPTTPTPATESRATPQAPSGAAAKATGGPLT